MEEELFEPFDFCELLQEDDQMRKESLCFSPNNYKMNSSSSPCFRLRNTPQKNKTDEPSFSLKSKIKLYSQSIKGTIVKKGLGWKIN